jgi:hypothetical protein
MCRMIIRARRVLLMFIRFVYLNQHALSGFQFWILDPILFLIVSELDCFLLLLSSCIESKFLSNYLQEEYVQKTNPAAAPLSFSDEQKKEVDIHDVVFVVVGTIIISP